MSDRDRDPLDAEARPSSWPLWFAIVCLAIVAIPYLDQALTAWNEDQRVRGTVVGFFDEVARGRRDAALDYLSDQYRSEIRAGWSPTFDQHWRPTEGTTFQILSLKRDATTAEVKVAIIKSTFSLKPTVHLRRLPQNAWRITRIDGVDVDPRWVRSKERESLESEKALADELAKSLHVPSLETAASSVAE